MARCSRNFFAEPTLWVAEKLLGKIMVFEGKKGIITETEAYVGKDDPACHAARGITPRTRVMFGPPGFTYVYFIYGMYHCLNFVTEPDGAAAAVLIRGLYMLDGSRLHLNGPGKLCRHLGITRQHNALDLVVMDDFFVEDANIFLPFKITPRIGISQGQDKLWRFVADPLTLPDQALKVPS